MIDIVVRCIIVLLKSICVCKVIKPGTKQQNEKSESYTSVYSDPLCLHIHAFI